MTTYQHTQSGKLVVYTMLAMTAIMVAIGCLVNRLAFVTVPILLLSAWLFNSLTIAIADGRLSWRFGPGLIQKSVSLADIASAKTVQTTFLEGWGIHMSRFGWLYNVAGRDAVAITLKDGKRFALGTDEPAALAAKLTARA